jgi:hypothetical protein
MEKLLIEAWYALMLEERFHPGRNAANRAGRLRDVVAWLNLDWLAVWSEMLEFARTGPILDAGPVNDAAGRWTARVNSGCMCAAERLTKLGLAAGERSKTEVAPSC